MKYRAREVSTDAQNNIGSNSLVPATPASKPNHMAAIDNDPLKASVKADPRKTEVLPRTSTRSPEIQKNRRFEILQAHFLRNANDPFRERIVACDEKWILHDNGRCLPSIWIKKKFPDIIQSQKIWQKSRQAIWK